MPWYVGLILLMWLVYIIDVNGHTREIKIELIIPLKIWFKLIETHSNVFTLIALSFQYLYPGPMLLNFLLQ